MLYEVITFPCDFLGAHYSSPEYFNDELHRPEQARQAFEFVITSYSIHYTKLYERHMRPDVDASARIRPVITSYSIHYTKLYDVIGYTL